MGIYRNWFLASRPWSLTMTIVSIATGFAFAAKSAGFTWWLFTLTLIAGIMVHLASNLLNDYFDVKNGVDFDSVATSKYRPHPLLEGKLQLKSVFTVSMLMYLIASSIGVYLVYTRGIMLLWIGLAGVFLAMTYTAPPLKYKYRGLGELGVLIIWGPLMIGGSYFIQSLTINWPIIIVSIPIGLLVVLVLLVNNIRDYESDKSREITTLAILFSPDKALHVYTTLVVLAFLWVIAISIFGPLSLWSLLVLLSLPIAIQLIKKMYKHVPDDADAETAKLDTMFGVLLLISIILSNYFG